MTLSYKQQQKKRLLDRANKSALSRVVRSIIGKADWSGYRQPSYETVYEWVEEAYKKGLKNGAERVQRQERERRWWNRVNKQ